MNIIYTDGRNKDFIALCQELDGFLNKIAGGEKNRKGYIPYNTLEDIKDVVLVYENGCCTGGGSFKKYNEDSAEIKRFFVKEEYRNKGIGKMILTELENKAKKKGFQRLILETGEVLEQATALYRKFGFMQIENYGPYVDMPESLCMEKYI